MFFFSWQMTLPICQMECHVWQIWLSVCPARWPVPVKVSLIRSWTDWLKDCFSLLAKMVDWLVERLWCSGLICQEMKGGLCQTASWSHVISLGTGDRWRFGRWNAHPFAKNLNSLRIFDKFIQFHIDEWTAWDVPDQDVIPPFFFQGLPLTLECKGWPMMAPGRDGPQTQAASFQSKSPESPNILSNLSNQDHLRPIGEQSGEWRVANGV